MGAGPCTVGTFTAPHSLPFILRPKFQGKGVPECYCKIATEAAGRGSRCKMLELQGCPSAHPLLLARGSSENVVEVTELDHWLEQCPFEGIHSPMPWNDKLLFNSRPHREECFSVFMASKKHSNCLLYSEQPNSSYNVIIIENPS